MNARLPKDRIVEKAKDFAAGVEKPDSKKTCQLYTAILRDESFWHWANSALFDNFLWAREAMAAGLNRNEIVALAKALERQDLHLASFDDAQAYRVLIGEMLHGEAAGYRRLLTRELRRLEEETATVLRFTSEGTVASGFKHGIPLTAYFLEQGLAFMAYSEVDGAHCVYYSSKEFEHGVDHILVRVARKIEENYDSFLNAGKLNSHVTNAGFRASTFDRLGSTVVA